MLLTEYAALSPVQRIRVAHEEALYTGADPKQVHGWLEQVCKNLPKPTMKAERE